MSHDTSISGLMVAWPNIMAGVFQAPAAAALLVGVPLLLLIMLIAGCVSLFLHDFVIPIMYLRRITVVPAWSELWHDLMTGRAGTFVLYIRWSGPGWNNQRPDNHGSLVYLIKISRVKAPF